MFKNLFELFSLVGPASRVRGGFLNDLQFDYRLTSSEKYFSYIQDKNSSTLYKRKYIEAKKGGMERAWQRLLLEIKF